MCKLKNNQNEYSTFLSTWFDLAFYIGLVPIRFRKSSKNENEDVFEICTNKFQKVFCGILNSLAIPVFWNQVRNAFSDIHERDPVTYLRLFFRIASLAHSVIFIRLVWTKSHAILQVLNILGQTRYGHWWLSSSSSSNKSSPKVPCKLTVVLILLVYPIVSLATAQIFVYLYNEPEVYLRKFVYQVKFSLFMEAALPQNDTVLYEAIPELQFHHYIVASLFLAAFICRNIMGFCTDGMILTVCLSLWFPVRQFSNALKRMEQSFYKNAISLSPVLEEYEQLKILSNSLNAAFQSILFSFVLQGTLFYSTSLKSIFCARMDIANLWLIMSFLSFSVIFLIAIDTCHQTEVFKEWLGSPGCRHKFNLSSHELHSKLFELQSYPIGHSGGGIFMINYSFFAQMCGAVFTYFMVTVQSDQIYIR